MPLEKIVEELRELGEIRIVGVGEKLEKNKFSFVILGKKNIAGGFLLNREDAIEIGKKLGIDLLKECKEFPCTFEKIKLDDEVILFLYSAFSLIELLGDISNISLWKQIMGYFIEGGYVILPRSLTITIEGEIWEDINSAEISIKIGETPKIKEITRLTMNLYSPEAKFIGEVRIGEPKNNKVPAELKVQMEDKDGKGKIWAVMIISERKNTKRQEEKHKEGAGEEPENHEYT